jgi:hypothetical protein
VNAASGDSFEVEPLRLSAAPHSAVLKAEPNRMGLFRVALVAKRLLPTTTDPVGDWFWSDGDAPENRWLSNPRDFGWDADVSSRAQSPAVSGMGYRTSGVGASTRRRLAAQATPRWG